MGSNTIIAIVVGAILVIVGFSLWPVLNGATNSLYSYFRNSCDDGNGNRFLQAYIGNDAETLPATLDPNAYYTVLRQHGGKGVRVIEGDNGTCAVPDTLTGSADSTGSVTEPARTQTDTVADIIRAYIRAGNAASLLSQVQYWDETLATPGPVTATTLDDYFEAVGGAAGAINPVETHFTSADPAPIDNVEDSRWSAAEVDVLIAALDAYSLPTETVTADFGGGSGVFNEQGDLIGSGSTVSETRTAAVDILYPFTPPPYDIYTLARAQALTPFDFADDTTFTMSSDVRIVYPEVVLDGSSASAPAIGDTYRWVTVAPMLQRFSGINNLLLTILPVVSIAGFLGISGAKLYSYGKGTASIGSSISTSVFTLIGIVVAMVIAGPILGAAVDANQVVVSGQYQVNTTFGNIIQLLFAMIPVVYIAGLVTLVGLQARSALMGSGAGGGGNMG